MSWVNFTKVLTALLGVTLADAAKLADIAWAAVGAARDEHLEGPKVYRAAQVAKLAYQYKQA